MMAPRRRSKHRWTRFRDSEIVEGVHLDADWTVSDGIAQLHFASLGEARGDYILRNMTSGIGTDSVNARGVFATQGRTAMSGVTTIGVGCGLSSGHAGMGSRSTLGESALWIHKDLGIFVAGKRSFVQRRMHHQATKFLA